MTLEETLASSDREHVMRLAQRWARQVDPVLPPERQTNVTATGTLTVNRAQLITQLEATRAAIEAEAEVRRATVQATLDEWRGSTAEWATFYSALAAGLQDGSLVLDDLNSVVPANENTVKPVPPGKVDEPSTKNEAQYHVGRATRQLREIEQALESATSFFNTTLLLLGLAVDEVINIDTATYARALGQKFSTYTR